MDRLNRWLTLAANIGVLIGIIILIVELRQNSQIMRAQTRAQLSEGIVNMLLENNADPAFNDIMIRGSKAEELSEVEQRTYNQHRMAMLTYWDNVFYQYQIGLYDAEEYSVQLSIIRNSITNGPGVRRHYCRSKFAVSPAFAAEIESEAVGGLCQESTD